MFYIRILCCAYLGFFSSLSQARSAQIWGLFIGIDDYAHFTSLQGSDNSLKLVYQALKDKYQFPDCDVNNQDFNQCPVSFLRDSEATKANTIQAFKSLNQVVQAEDYVYIHFSGHGQAIDSQKNANQTAWVLHETPKKGEDKGLSDKEILDLILPISQKTQQFILVTDACYSVVIDTPARHEYGDFLQINSGQSSQVSWEKHFDKEIDNYQIKSDVYSVFNLLWYKNLLHSPQSASWQTLYEQTWFDMGTHKSQQLPTILGMADIIPFSATLPNPHDLLQVESIDDENHAYTNKGRLHGLYTGDRYVVPQAPQQQITLGKIEDTHSYSKEQGQLAVKQVLQEAYHAPRPDQRFNIALEAEQDNQPFIAKLTAALARLPSYCLLDSVNTASHCSNRKNINADFVIKKGQGRLLLFNPSGQFPSIYLSRYQSEKEWYRLLRSFLRIAELAALPNYFQKCPIKLSFRPFQAVRNKNQCVENCMEHPLAGKKRYFSADKCFSSAMLKQQQLAPEQLWGLILGNPHLPPQEDDEDKTLCHTPLYAYVYNITPMGAIELVFPLLKAGVPPELARLPPEQMLQLDNWRLRGLLSNDECTGTQQLKILISAEPLSNPQFWEQAAYDKEVLYQPISTAQPSHRGLWAFNSLGDSACP